jgi:hypothetical protein
MDKPDIVEVEKRDAGGLLESVIHHARDFHDGHFFVLAFTTHYKGGYGTPDFDFGTGRDEILILPGFKTIAELLDHMLTPCCVCIRMTEKRLWAAGIFSSAFGRYQLIK